MRSPMSHPLAPPHTLPCSQVPRLGLVRAVQLYPTKLLGAVADYGDFPVKRAALDKDCEGRWVGSVGYEEVLKMTDLKAVLKDEGEKEKEKAEDSEGSGSDNEAEDEDQLAGGLREKEDGDESAHGGSVVKAESSKEGEEEEPEKKPQKRKRKKEKNSLEAAQRTKARNELDVDRTFFADL